MRIPVPPKNNPLWADIVTGRKRFVLKSLGAKILLGRLMRSVGTAPTPDNIEHAVEQLHAIYAKNATSPSVQEDIQTIFG
ncbi:hypothetical protein Despr_2002 [Desulfobulbus propionicus DSM 2032]|jgi:1-acyl-sn-glycerol-3-phosphate acyltransferase|uniref:Uncharacterized protein n=1 Tax=Desulfobulbus propionicus (strain ATCC 33891 / DSM 2032 / VKM B-1956 / 1pr3) TaxID=577650 RepID=A0A7U3YMK0_DESPD|nr:hypothetical protein [Desulfobulbus propionicus]ADW18150.1 hypothetical protein Despr_2002 [Desulfobulbus propionicus DSM 2032]